MDSNILIRPINENDALSIINLRKKLSIETPYMLQDFKEVCENENKCKNNIKNFLESENMLYLVAYYENELVGFITCNYRDFKRVRHVSSFVIGVLSKFWGIGISQDLLDKTILWCNSKNIKRLELEVVEENLRAVNFYKKNGFYIEGKKIKDHFIDENNYLNTLIMAKFL